MIGNMKMIKILRNYKFPESLSYDIQLICENIDSIKNDVDLFKKYSYLITSLSKCEKEVNSVGVTIGLHTVDNYSIDSLVVIQRSLATDPIVIRHPSYPTDNHSTEDCMKLIDTVLKNMHYFSIIYEDIYTLRMICNSIDNKIGDSIYIHPIKVEKLQFASIINNLYIKMYTMTRMFEATVKWWKEIYRILEKCVKIDKRVYHTLTSTHEDFEYDTFLNKFITVYFNSQFSKYFHNVETDISTDRIDYYNACTNDVVINCIDRRLYLPWRERCEVKKFKNKCLDAIHDLETCQDIRHVLGIKTSDEIAKCIKTWEFRCFNYKKS